MIVIDSCGWIEFFAEGSLGPQYREIITGKTPIAVPTIVIFEVYKWVQRELGEDYGQVSVEGMKKRNVIPLSPNLAIQSAQVSQGYKLPLADAIVYATALSCEAIVVTHDRHFKGLDCVNYLEK